MSCLIRVFIFLNFRVSDAIPADQPRVDLAHILTLLPMAAIVRLVTMHKTLTLLHIVLLLLRYVGAEGRVEVPLRDVVVRLLHARHQVLHPDLLRLEPFNPLLGLPPRVGVEHHDVPRFGRVSLADPPVLQRGERGPVVAAVLVEVQVVPPRPPVKGAGQAYVEAVEDFVVLRLPSPEDLLPLVVQEVQRHELGDLHDLLGLVIEWDGLLVVLDLLDEFIDGPVLVEVAEPRVDPDAFDPVIDFVQELFSECLIESGRPELERDLVVHSVRHLVLLHGCTILPAQHAVLVGEQILQVDLRRVARACVDGMRGLVLRLHVAVVREHRDALEPGHAAAVAVGIECWRVVEGSRVLKHGLVTHLMWVLTSLD